MARSQSFRSILILLILSLFIAACGGGGGGGSSDLTPNSFSFSAEDAVERGATIESDPITVSGIDKAVTISVTGGEYSINDGAYTSTAGTVSQGQTVKVRLTASSEFATAATSTVTIGGISGAFSATTIAQDTTPDDLLDFPSKTLQGLGLVVVSDPITVLGINDAATVTISDGGEYAIDSGDFTSDEGQITSGQTITVRLTASSSFSTPTVVTLTIGGEESEFTATTLLQDTTPETLADFAPKATQGLGAQVISDPITISNINDAASISVSAGGEYAINGGAFTSDSGQVSSGQTVVIRLTASSDFSTPTVVTLTVGGVESEFTATTLLQDTSPETLVDFASVDGQDLEDVVNSASVTITNINDAANVTVTGGAYSIDSGDFTTAAGQVSSGESIRVQVTTSELFSTPATVTLTVGGVEASFMATTLAQDLEPSTFSIAAVPDAIPSAIVTSDAIDVTGINDSIAISVSAGATYSIDSTSDEDFTSAVGTVDSGQQVRVRLSASPSSLGESEAILTLGSGDNAKSATFTVTTIEDEAAPSASIHFPPAVSLTEGTSITVRGVASDEMSSITRVQINGEDVTSDDGFASWQVSILLDAGSNTLVLSVEDSEGNTNEAVDEVTVTQGSIEVPFPSDSLSFAYEGLREIELNLESNRLLVTDVNGGIPTFSRLVAIDLDTGVRSSLSGNSPPNDDVPMLTVAGLAVDEDAREVYLSAEGGDGEIWVVDLDTLDRTLISTNDTVTDLGGDIFSMELDRDEGRLLVSDFDNNRIVKAQLNNGARGILFNRPVEFGGSSGFAGLRLDSATNTLFVTDREEGVFTLDLTLETPTAEVLPDVSNVGGVSGIDIDEALNRLLLVDYSQNSLFFADMTTGERSLISGPLTPNAFNAFVLPGNLVFDSGAGLVYVLESTDTFSSVFAVDVDTGERVIIARSVSI